MNPTPSQPERPEHNPDGLTPEQYGAPEYELLAHEEVVQRSKMDGSAFCKDLVECWYRGQWGAGFFGGHLGLTYRRRVATRTPAPEAVEGEPKSAMFLVWLMLGGLNRTFGEFEDLYSKGGDTWLRRAIFNAAITKSATPTPPVEADKDAEIAPIEKAAELCGWERVPAAGPTVWHLKGHGFTITKDLPYSLRDQLTTARATIAERDKRIERLVDLLKRAKWIFDYSTPSYPAKTRDLQNDINTALAHAAEVKEQV